MPDFFEVYLQDEVPKLGCGRRIVSAKLGRKWAYLACPTTGTRSRLNVDAFKALRPVKVKVRAKYRKRKTRRKADADRV